MEQRSAPDPNSYRAVVEDLVGSASRGAPDNLTRITRAFDQAARLTPGETGAVDGAIVASLIESPHTDELLEQVDLQDLAGLLERVSAALARGGDPPDTGLRGSAWDLLDLIRRPAVLRRIEPRARDAWAARILSLIERSHLTVGPLFRHRAAVYGPKVLFELPSKSGLRTLTWRQVAGRVELLARGLLSLEPEGTPGPVAVISENCLEMALVDLACLTSGTVNVLIPATSTESDVGYMLRHSRVRTAVVSGREQLEKVLAHRETLPELRRVVSIEPLHAGPKEVLSLDGVASRAHRVGAGLVRERSDAVRIGDLASVMYTSGTTGAPKGIRFSHRNVVFKRFARALALPEIGEDDVFLCYLPLYHTFGRYLELLGCVYWGATYCFLERPSVDAMARGMRLHRPTVFISVPKKWMQLYEAISAKADPLEASDEALLAATREITGGRLRWGLSAAGHLDSEIFRFFQRNGVELMSGFGMTEATGGITMTPPAAYKDDSLGVALPGIELRLEQDGELLVRGPYVMEGYLDPPDGAEAFDGEGWLPTGDLMEVDGEGFLRLVDRKKEIYKNIKGETIAPQRVENLFRDFEAVQRVFLVGDHRPYNTVLIYPNAGFEDLDLGALSPEELRTHLRSIVVSVNKFLSPFERIVDFAVIDRDLDPEMGELTPKGTLRRSTIERNFAGTIRQLYQRTSFRVGGIDLIVPNWLFQALGLTAQDVRVTGHSITIPASGAALKVRKRGRVVQVGSCLYSRPDGPLNLGVLLTRPRLWLGNEDLVEFVSLDLPSLERPGRPAGMDWHGRSAPVLLDDEREQAFEKCRKKSDLDLMDLHLSALVLASGNKERALHAIGLLEEVLGEEEGPLADPVRMLLARTSVASSVEVRRRAFQTLAPAERDSRFGATLQRFLAAAGILLDKKTRAIIAKEDLTEPKLEAFIAATLEACRNPAPSRHAASQAISLLRLISEYGAMHPTSYCRLRALLVGAKLFAGDEQVRKEAARSVDTLTRGFRQWLGPSSRIAVDPETGEEYGWDDVVVFAEDVDPQDRRRLLSALKNTGLLREGVFLFSGGATIRLNDIPPGGVWVRLLGSRHGKSVYRIAVQTRYEGSFDLAVNVNHALSREQIEEETNWLILCGNVQGRGPLVEDFGGYWADQDLWSEEFIAGETLERALRRLSRREKEQDRLRQLWPFFAWTTLSAYVDFWNRTGRRWEIADAGMSNVVVPMHDYLSGARIVSLSNRRAHEGLAPMLLDMQDSLVRPAEQTYPALEGLVPWSTVFSSVLEVTGEDEGLTMFRELLGNQDNALPAALRDELARYVADVESSGFLPLRLYFAAERYRRWSRLSDESAPPARARTLLEIYETYGLPRLVQSFPEVRVRFFLETVFRESPPPLVEGLEELVGKLRRRELSPEQLIDAVPELRSRLDPGPEDDYFLARLSFPYLRPEDSAAFVQSDRGGKHSSEMVVRLEDHEGAMFRVRHAMNPKEVGRLHQQFLAAKLEVRFRPEHQYLVALNERNQIIGGIYYDVEEDGQSAHLEKIVVAERYRKKGVADGLMKEFFNRLKTTGVKTVTTGFFRPEYFYAHGFKIEKRYAGLVRPLEEE